MWGIISKLLLNLVVSIVSDKVVVDGAKKFVTRAIDSKVEGIGIDNEDAKSIIKSISSSTLNILEETITDEILQKKGV